MKFKLNIKFKTLLKYLAGIVTAFTIIGLTLFQYSRSWQNALFIEPLYKLDTTEKIIALTFDDGPSIKRTPKLLSLLKKHNVKATFFMLGENIIKNPEIAKSVYLDGHLIGNHSFNHSRLIFKSPTYIQEQISLTDNLIKLLGQREVKFFRPPYSSKFIILPLVLKSLDKKLVTGTYDPPSEYKRPYNGRIVSNEVLLNAKPGSIIYLHDGVITDSDPFIESVELIILGLKDKGFKFVKLDYIF